MPTMTPKSLLQATESIIAKPERWAKGTETRSEKGNPVKAGSPKEFSCCLEYAIRKAFVYLKGMDDYLELTPVRRQAWDVLESVIQEQYAVRVQKSDHKAQYDTVVVPFNDHKLTTHAEVIAVLKEAQNRCPDTV